MADVASLLIRADAQVQNAIRQLDRVSNALEGVQRQGSAIGEAAGGVASFVMQFGKLAGALPVLAVGANAAGGLAAALLQAGMSAGTLAAGVAAVGLGVGAFAAAAKPALADVTNAYKLQTAAIAASAQGGAAATAAQKKYNEAIANLSPAQKAVLTSFNGLNNEYQEWSKGLQNTTLPVFVTWLDAARGVLPKLTPAVKAASESLTKLGQSVGTLLKGSEFQATISAMTAKVGPLMDSMGATFINVVRGMMGLLRAFLPATTELGTGIQSLSEKFANWAVNLEKNTTFTNMLSGSFDQLKTILSSVWNVMAGLGNIIMAFQPQASTMSGGLLDLTQKFRDFTAGLSDSPAFQAFVQYATDNGPVLAKTLGDVALALIKLLTAMTPFGPIVLKVVDAFAQLINNTPTPVLAALVGTIATLTLGIKLFQLAMSLTTIVTAAWSAAVTVANGALTLYRTGILVFTALTAGLRAGFVAWTASVWASTVALLASPITWIVLGIVALVAIIILIATKTTWFQTAWEASWNAIKIALSAAWDFIKMVLQAAWDWIVFLFENFTLPGILMKHWDTIKAGVSAAWEWIKSVVKGAWDFLVNLFMNWSLPGIIMRHWDTIKNGVSAAWNWIKDTISNAFNGAKDAVMNAANAIGSFISGIKDKAVNALSDAASWLFNAGKSIIQGLIDGIKNMAGNVTNAVKGVLQSARNLLPFSPAKEGPFSGSGWTLYSGQSMAQGIAQGLISQTGAVTAAMAGLMTGMTVPLTGTVNSMAGLGAGINTGAFLPVPAGAGAGAGGATVTFDFNGADQAFKTAIQKIVRVDGRGNVQNAFGQTR